MPLPHTVCRSLRDRRQSFVERFSRVRLSCAAANYFCPKTERTTKILCASKFSIADCSEASPN